MGNSLLAQNVAINADGSKPNANAMLDIKSSGKGLLIPRMSTDARMKIPNTQGLFVYDINNNSFYNSIGLLQAYPNPARDRVTVAVYSDADKQGAVTLQDARGHVLERRQVRYVKGMNTLQWNISGYAAGTYYLVMDSGGTNLEIVKQ